MELFRSKKLGHIKNSASESSSQAETNHSQTTLDAVSSYWSRGGSRERELQDYGEEDDSIPQTEVEAQEHIAKIRKEKGLHGTDNNTADLEAALIVLSEQLYQKSTHFLLELVQNVDDNAYTVSTPTLNITYKNRTLRIDCNEMGFSKKNVAAICRVGRSSKSKLNNARRYIGEKGIGFKSVFKVSDIVWIHSGHYSFKFDKSQRLGMIAPIWTAFPAKIMPGFTSILLKLSQDCNVIELVQEIKALDPRLLIFLQKLKIINIAIQEGGKDPWQTSLQRRDEQTGDIAQQLVTLHEKSRRLSYRIFRFQVKNLPDDPKRVGIKQSELLLAFPLDDFNKPKIQSQNVYAFLPIRDYGFKFLLQADFLLIASREDIDSSSPWNRALLRHIPQALLGAINEFNSGELRYSWLPYLPFRPYVGDFFKELEEETIRLLCGSPILEPFLGPLKPPSSLTYVPGMFSDKEGRPLILTDVTKMRYLSHKYPSSDRHLHSSLGVRDFTTEDFLNDLRHYLKKTPADFRNMPYSWHSRLAEALLSAIARSLHWKPTIADLEIVPLRDGRWVSMKSGNLLFPSRSSNLVVPKGIDIFEIHPCAETDYFQRQLFMSLGAKEFQADQICDIIIRTHQKSDFPPNGISTSDLMSHAIFLYNAGWKNTERHDIWFATEAGLHCHGSYVYMDSDVAFSAKSMFAKHRSEFHFLHQKYYATFSSITLPSDSQSEMHAYQEWLLEQGNIAQVPRLATPSNGAPFGLSKDFKYLIDLDLTVDILLLLKHHWKHYSKWIVNREKNRKSTIWEISQQTLRSKISSMDVKCHGEITSPLNKTVLPLTEMHVEAFTSAPFLDVPEPNDDRWEYLSDFGVIVQLDAMFFVDCLRRLKEGKTSTKEAALLYGYIDQYTNPENTGDIRRSFVSHKLVFIPVENSDIGGNWMDLNDCVWSGPRCLKATPCLAMHYPEHEPLFHDTLRIGDCNIKTLVLEAQHIIPSDSIDHIAQIFVALNKYLDISMTGTSMLPLIGCNIFPVVTRKSPSDFDFLCTAAETDLWFIADRIHLRESFESLVPLLAFDPIVIDKIGLLIHELGLGKRMLSKAAKGVSKTEGRVDFHPGYTKLLQRKARCIARLVPKESSNRTKILQQLRNIEVYKSEQVIVEWIVKSLNGDTFYGRADSGRVALTTRNQGLAIYLTEEDINASVPPLELQEELATFGEIQEPKHLTLLLYLLMQEDPKAIEDILQRRGISNSVPEFDARNDVEDEEKPVSQPKIFIPSRPIIKKLEFWCRRKPAHDENSSNGLGEFIRRVERVSNVQKSLDEPWGSADIGVLFSRICRLEGQDMGSLLPQANTKSGAKKERSISALLDSKTGLWTDAMIREEDLSRPETVDFGQFPTRSEEIKYAIDKEVQFIGELNVSAFLEKHLGQVYVPKIHWTSHLRSRAGLMPYECHNLGTSTFTITDSSGAFTKFLAEWGYIRAALWSENHTYHIKVLVSTKGVLSEFCLDPLQVKKAQECSVIGNKVGDLHEVFILITVYNILSDPGMALFVDPWQLHVNGSLSLLAHSPYHASFKDTVSAIFLHNSPELARSGKGRVSVYSTSSLNFITTAPTTTSRPGPVKEDGLFSYRPLRNHREIRLLELFPGDEDAPLQGTIHHASVDSPGKYWAISYVWGAAPKPFYFQTPEGKIPLTVSLHSALQSARDKEHSILLWADAICIDQDKKLEKSIQIRLMRTIFQSAEGVIAWLGEEKDNSHLAIEALLQIRMIVLKPHSWPEGLPAIPVSWGGRDTPSLRDSTWKDIDLLLSRSWFRRSWIVQELILASNVIVNCGRWSLNWDDLFEGLKICRDKLQSEEQVSSEQGQILAHGDPAYALGLTRESRIKFNDAIFGHKYHLLELLDLFAYTQASEERDKIFALLGLATDCSGDVFDPDYESPLEDVVRRYASEFVRRGLALDLLYRAGTSKAYPFCSWIPFWTRGNFPQTISSWRGERGNFSAGGKRSTRAQVLPTNKCVLSVRGFSFDTIVRVSGIRTEESDIISFVNSIYSSVESLKSYPTGESRHDLKWKLPIGNAGRPYLEPTNQYLIPREIIVGDPKPKNWPPDLGRNISMVNSKRDMMNFLKKPQNLRDLTWNYWQTAAAFAKRISNGTMCFTKMGYVGIVPGDSRVGDEVCVFNGAAVPFVLRKTQATAEEIEYQLIGEGYIHGIMYGEALSFNHTPELDFHIV